MTTLDIREKDEKIDRIKFDNTAGDLVLYGTSSLCMKDLDDKDFYILCSWSDFDNFIKACHKARELWEPKE